MTESLSSPADVARWRNNLQAEVDGASIYRAMAANAGDDRLATLYAEMAATEERHADLWRTKLTETGAGGSVRPSLRAQLLAFTARRLGAGLVAPMIARQERQGQTMYDEQPEAVGTTLAEDERSHARVLHRITGGASGATLAKFEGRHRALDGNALRAVLTVDFDVGVQALFEK